MSVAIPVLISYHWISAKIAHLVGEMDLMTVGFVETYAEAGRFEAGGRAGADGREFRIRGQNADSDPDAEPADESEEDVVATAS